MNELLLKYLDYLVEHQLHNDAGVRWVRDALQGDVGVWALAVMRYSQTMGDSDKGYLHFRKKWAWKDEKVDKILASETGKNYKLHIAEVEKNFNAQDTASGYKLGTGSLRRSLQTQTDLWQKNWSVKKMGPDITAKLNQELQDGKYPDPPDEESAKKFYKFIRNIKLKAVRKDEKSGWKTTPTNAAPGLSDHGRLSAVDFVVSKGGKDIGADSSQIPLWRAKDNGSPSLEERLKNAIEKLNKSAGATVFDGPLKSPDEPWHYTYVAIQAAEDKDTAADASH